MLGKELFLLYMWKYRKNELLICLDEVEREKSTFRVFCSEMSRGKNQKGYRG
jgi:hypothetical protein